jgi:ATP adenylyltransferase
MPIADCGFRIADSGIDANPQSAITNPQFGKRGGRILGQNILWAPWRIPYIRGLEKDDDCFLCHNLAHPEEDERNLVLWRTGRSIVVLNRFPYNNGHLLVAPARHIADFTEASEDEMLELVKLVREAQRALSLAIHPHGFNVGLNFGRGGAAARPPAISTCRAGTATQVWRVCCDARSVSLADLWRS